MDIKAKCLFDYNSVKAASHMAFYGRNNPVKTFTFSVIFSIFLSLLCLIGIRCNLVISHVLIWVPVFILILNCFFYLAFPRIQLKGLRKMKQIENEYTFSDEHIKVLSRGEEYAGEATLRYTMIPKVVENSRYYFIYQSDNQVFVVDKATVSNGSVSELRDILRSSVSGKYVICKY